MRKAISVSLSGIIFLLALETGTMVPVLAQEVEETFSELSVDTDLEMVPGARIAVVTKNSTGSFFNNLQKGMEDAIAQYNEAYGLEKDDKLILTCEGPKDETNIDSQINSMDAVIAENPDVLCLSAGDMESCVAQLESAKENGIPVIMFDSDVQSDLYDSFVGTDNHEAAAKAAEKMAQAMGEKGKVVVFAHQGKTRTSAERVAGYQDKMEEYPELEIVDIVFWDEQEDMISSMKEFLEQHEEIGGVFCTNGETAELYLSNVANAFSDRGLIFVGVDANKTQQEAVKNGIEYGLVAQQPYLIGYETIRQAVRALCETDVEPEVLLETAWLNAAAIENPAYATYLEY